LQDGGVGSLVGREEEREGWAARNTYLVDDIDATALVLDAALELLETQAVPTAGFVEAPHGPGVCVVCRVQEWMRRGGGWGEALIVTAGQEVDGKRAQKQVRNTLDLGTNACHCVVHMSSEVMPVVGCWERACCVCMTSTL
jgi:hypothetical protein